MGEDAHLYGRKSTGHTSNQIGIYCLSPVIDSAFLHKPEIIFLVGIP